MIEIQTVHRKKAAPSAEQLEPPPPKKKKHTLPPSLLHSQWSGPYLDAMVSVWTHAFAEPSWPLVAGLLSKPESSPLLLSTSRVLWWTEVIVSTWSSIWIVTTSSNHLVIGQQPERPECSDMAVEYGRSDRASGHFIMEIYLCSVAVISVLDALPTNCVCLADVVFTWMSQKHHFKFFVIHWFVQ